MAWLFHLAVAWGALLQEEVAQHAEETHGGTRSPKFAKLAALLLASAAASDAGSGVPQNRQAGKTRVALPVATTFGNDVGIGWIPELLDQPEDLREDTKRKLSRAGKTRDWNPFGKRKDWSPTQPISDGRNSKQRGASKQVSKTDVVRLKEFLKEKRAAVRHQCEVAWATAKAVVKVVGTVASFAGYCSRYCAGVAARVCLEQYGEWQQERQKKLQKEQKRKQKLQKQKQRDQERKRRKKAISNVENGWKKAIRNVDPVLVR